MKISIAMCTWNGAAYLAAQLDSIAKQTRKPDELVICDDVSEDNTKAILRSFATTVNFPVHINENPTRLGSTANFSKAISLCQGDIIVLSDQDDVWQIEKLAIFEQHFETSSTLGGIFTDAELIDQHGNRLHDYLWNKMDFGLTKQKALRKGQGFESLIQSNFVTGATLAFHSCWKDLVLPIPMGWVHDYWIALLLSAESRLDCLPKPLIQYRIHPEQQIGININRKHNLTRMLSRLNEIDNTTYLQVAQRCDEIVHRFSEFDAINLSEAIMRCHKISPHFWSRGTLSKERFKRVPVIIREILNGNYFHYSQGMKSIFRDIMSDFRHGTYL